jgi:ubiquinone/menaquinone biosynthesis C-methylase UbiE
MNARRQLDEMISGYRATQIIRTAVLLCIPEALANGPLTSVAVAERLGLDQHALVHRLMRCLAAFGVLVEQSDARFANSEMGALLLPGAPGRLRDAAVGRTVDEWREAWGALHTGIVNGRVPFEIAHGRSFWTTNADPASAERFNAFMTAKTSDFVHDLLEHHNISWAQHIVDVGGGSGALIAGLLQAATTARGTVFDTESGLADAEQLLREYGVRDRCTLAAGSFFEHVPAGGDVYILRQILHDWPDDRAAEILAACRRSMRVGEQLLVIDQILPDIPTNDPAQRYAFEMDLHMFVLFGARERTESELTAMITHAGFAVSRIVPTQPERTLVAMAV